ncbi:hypothetical protein MF271_22355 (plasmid) [Deinococcus sp. KNUC1210]|uniref:hypothetical protein n=1 Tax=Deinococcus sp. KNUC1210 TaxID=2917691 RepID=UPI001EF02B0B|nr:hypothetical protein [Deinococcus sp. KNUC1210]ULH18215.1 hypothetical protein MF271_22355 [Deinococcus sp. KNUC1210]
MNTRSLLVTLFPLLSLCAAAQTSDDLRWTRLDITQDGWLSGTELTACGCASADVNHDGEVTRAEFMAAQARVGTPPAATSSTRTAPSPQPAAIPATVTPACTAFHFSGQPVTRDMFFSLWTTLSPSSAICLVQARGVSFNVTAADERRINTGFSYPDVIAALRANYRAPAPVHYNAARVSTGRYACGGFATASTIGKDRADLTIVDASHYRSDTAAGTYTYTPQTRVLTFGSGPFAKHGWVGVYLPDGFPDETGYRMEGDTVVIRTLKDIQAGNQHDLQACKRARE